MNVYDDAHNLARSIKESTEYKEYVRIKNEVEKDEQLSQMLKDLQDKQIQMQAAQFAGEEPNAELMSQVQSIATMLATKPMASQYMQAEANFSVMMNDVFNIIGEAVGLK